jgi:type IV secretory pathway VirB3-like protein
MAADLSFFEYKRAVLDGVGFGFDLETNSLRTPLQGLDDSDFYRLSFYNRGAIELEYRLLTMLLHTRLSEQDKKRAQFYLEASARFLLRDAQIADNTAEAKKYNDYISQRDKQRETARTLTPIVNATSVESEWKQAWDAFKEDLAYWLAAPWYASRFITLLSYANLYRLMTVFSRLSFKFFWMLASERQWIDAQDRIFGIPLQRSALELPTTILNFVSVALFALRLIAHFLMIIKHARSQRTGEKDIPVWDRIMKEYSVRMINIMNDIAWVLINLLTNYAALFHIADPVANALLALTLVWDCAWLGIHWYREERDWANKEKQLLSWQQANASDSCDVALIDLQLQMLKDLQLETRAKYIFMIAAGLSIMTSFLLFLAGFSALISTICLTICVLGFAMYGSAEEFGAWMRASLGTMKIAEEREKNQAKFFKVFTQSLLPPFMVMGLLSLGWQASFLGAVGALAYAYSPARRDGNLPPPRNLDNEPPAFAQARVAPNSPR